MNALIKLAMIETKAFDKQAVIEQVFDRYDMNNLVIAADDDTIDWDAKVTEENLDEYIQKFKKLFDSGHPQKDETLSPEEQNQEEVVQESKGESVNEIDEIKAAIEELKSKEDKQLRLMENVVDMVMTLLRTKPPRKRKEKQASAKAIADEYIRIAKSFVAGWKKTNTKNKEGLPGWKDESTGDVRYQENRPGEMPKEKSPKKEEPEAKKPEEEKTTPKALDKPIPKWFDKDNPLDSKNKEQMKGRGFTEIAATDEPETVVSEDTVVVSTKTGKHYRFGDLPKSVQDRMSNRAKEGDLMRAPSAKKEAPAEEPKKDKEEVKQSLLNVLKSVPEGEDKEKNIQTIKDVADRLNVDLEKPIEKEPEKEQEAELEPEKKEVTPEPKEEVKKEEEKKVVPEEPKLEEEKEEVVPEEPKLEKEEEKEPEEKPLDIKQIDREFKARPMSGFLSRMFKGIGYSGDWEKKKRSMTKSDFAKLDQAETEAVDEDGKVDARKFSENVAKALGLKKKSKEAPKKTIEKVMKKPSPSLSKQHEKMMDSISKTMGKSPAEIEKLLKEELNEMDISRTKKKRILRDIDSVRELYQGLFSDATGKVASAAMVSRIASYFLGQDAEPKEEKISPELAEKVTKRVMEKLQEKKGPEEKTEAPEETEEEEVEKEKETEEETPPSEEPAEGGSGEFDEDPDSLVIACIREATQGMQLKRKDKDMMDDTGGGSYKKSEPKEKPPRYDLKKPWSKKKKKPSDLDEDVDKDKDLKAQELAEKVALSFMGAE